MTSLRSGGRDPLHSPRPPPIRWLGILRVGRGHAAPVDNDRADARWTTLRVAHVAHRRLDNPCGVAHMPTPPATVTRKRFSEPGSRAIGAFGAEPLSSRLFPRPLSTVFTGRFAPVSVAGFIRTTWPDSPE